MILKLTWCSCPVYCLWEESDQGQDLSAIDSNNPQKNANMMFINWVAGNVESSLAYAETLLSHPIYATDAREIMASTLLCSKEVSDQSKAFELYQLIVKTLYDGGRGKIPSTTNAGMELAKKGLALERVQNLYSAYAIDPGLKGGYPLLKTVPATPNVNSVTIQLPSELEKITFEPRRSENLE